MLRTRLATLLATVSLVVVGLAGIGSPAGAHVVPGTSAVNSSAQPTVAPEFTPMSEWMFYGYYPSLRNCKDEGNRLIDLNFIYNYSCVYRNGRYELYVQYTE